MYNKQRRTYEREEDQTRIPSWWRETGRSTCERREVSTGAHPGDAAGTPLVSDYGPEVHRNRILGHSKSSRKRSSRRVCLELNMRAPSRGLATSHPSQATSVKRQATSLKLQATSAKLQASSYKRLNLS
jgi:hypothetical protein